MIALALGFPMFGLAGIAAFYVAAALIGVVVAPIYWAWQLARCPARVVIVVTVVGYCAAAKAISGVAWRVWIVAARFARIVVMAFLYMAGVAQLARPSARSLVSGEALRASSIRRGAHRHATLNHAHATPLALFAKGDTLTEPERRLAHDARPPPESEVKLDRRTH